MHSYEAEEPLLQGPHEGLGVGLAQHCHLPCLVLAENHQGIQQLIGADGLLQEGADAHLTSLGHQAGIFHGTDHDDLGLGVYGVDAFGALDAVCVRQVHVHGHYRRTELAVHLDSFRGVPGHRYYLKVRPGQSPFQHGPADLGIIDDHYFDFLHKGSPTSL